MAAIRMQTNVMFGSSGQVQDILMSLQDTRLAKRTLMDNMKKFDAEMRSCVQKARDIETSFDKLINCAKELNEAMANEMKWSAIALGTVASATGALTGTLHAVVSIVKKTPKLAVEVVRTAGHTIGHVVGKGAVNINYTESNVTSSTQPLGNQTSDVGIDPALLVAEQIETQVMRLQGLVEEDLVSILQDGGAEFIACSKQLGNLKNSLGTFKSKHTVNANAILGDSIEVATSVLKEKDSVTSDTRTKPDWQVKKERWQKTLSDLLSAATRLRSFAAAQPGQGFGSTMGIPAPVSPEDSAYTQVLKVRHEKLVITKTAMKDAQDNLTRSQDMQLASQAKIIEFSRIMDDLNSKTATIEETKTILRKSLDCMTSMQPEVKRLAGFFEMLGNIISIVGVPQAEYFIATIKAGTTFSQCSQ